MTVDLGVLVVGTSAPSGNLKSDADRDDWVWLNPGTGELNKFNPATGSYDINIPVKSHDQVMSSITGLVDALAGKSATSHAHATHGDINFTGTISAGGVTGMDIDFTGEMKKITRLVIINGLVTQLEYEV